MDKPFAIVVVAVAVAIVVAPRIHRRVDDSGMVAVPTEKARLDLLERRFFPAQYVNPEQLEAVIMEWNTGGDTVATLVAFADGTTSLYLSSGRGILNARSKNVQTAATRFRDLAMDRADQFFSTADFDPPRSGKSRFYIITGSQTRATDAQLTTRLTSPYSNLKELTAAGQTTITVLREEILRPGTSRARRSTGSAGEEVHSRSDATR